MANHSYHKYWKSKKVNIHPTAVLENNYSIEIGEGTEIGAMCYLKGPLVIGKNNKIYPSCIIGTDAEHRTKTQNDPITIGDNNVIRELTVIQRGTGDRPTTIGNDCFIMDHVHIAHDCLIQDEVNIAPNVVFAGHVKVLKGATIGVLTAVHQFTTIGAHAMVGMNSTVTKDVYPFTLVMGSPATYSRLNSYKVTKFGVTDATFSNTCTKEIEEFFKEFEQFSTRK